MSARASGTKQVGDRPCVKVVGLKFLFIDELQALDAAHGAGEVLDSSPT